MARPSDWQLCASWKGQSPAIEELARAQSVEVASEEIFHAAITGGVLEYDPSGRAIADLNLLPRVISVRPVNKPSRETQDTNAELLPIASSADHQFESLGGSVGATIGHPPIVPDP